MSGRTVGELEVGMSAELTKTYGEWDVYTFAALTGDLNPAHVDQAFAEATAFKGRIAHGLLTASLISAVLGTKLPGPGSIYLSQDLKFLRPVRVGDTVTARVEVVELIREKNLAKLKTTCANQKGEVVLDGTALVMPPKVARAELEGAGAKADARPAAGSEQKHRPDQERAVVKPAKAGSRVGDRMSPKPLTISPEATLAEARALLYTHRIRHLPVVDRGELVGIITDRDIRQASLPGPVDQSAPETDALLRLIKVSMVMTRDVIAVTPDATIAEAATLLVSHRIGGLPVVEGRRLVGIITETDILEALMDIMGVSRG